MISCNKNKYPLNLVLTVAITSLLLFTFAYGAGEAARTVNFNIATKTQTTSGTDVESVNLDFDKINQSRLEKSQRTKKIEALSDRSWQQQVMQIKSRGLQKAAMGRATNKKHQKSANPFQLNSNPTSDRIPAVMGSSARNSSRDNIDILINGADSDTITQGEDFEITIYFSTGVSDAEIFVFVDMDDNGALNDTVDIVIGDASGYIADNDMDDDDLDNGVYKMIFSGGDEGPNMVSNLGMLFEVVDDSASDVAFLYIAPQESQYSVSGTVTPPMANIIIAAFPMRDDHRDNNHEPWMTVTDTLGNYQNFLPENGMYGVVAFDFLGVSDGMFPDTAYFDVPVMGHLIDYDFEFIEPNATVQGYVLDESGDPVADVYVWVEMEYGPDVSVMTGVDGFYTIGVLDGEWWVGLDSWDLIPEYLVPKDTMVYVAESGTVNVNFTVYSTDSQISGTVFLDGYPMGDINIGAWSYLGWTESRTEPNGMYFLQVSSEADDFGGYDLGVWDHLPPNVIVVDYPSGINSGFAGVDINLVSVLGGIEGMIYDANTLEPLDFAWIHASNDMEWYGTGSWDGGYYYLPLPNGSYDLRVGADDYFRQQIGNIIIQDNVLTMDFYLDTVEYNGSLSGYVYEEGTTNGIAGVEVQVGTQMYWDNTVTENSGYYYFDLPNGTYNAIAWKEGYNYDWTENLVIADDNITHDFYLREMEINSVIEGVVYDEESGDPIIGAWAYAWSPFYETGTYTSADGYYYLEVPSDSFWVNAGAPEYHWSDGVFTFVAPEETLWVEFGLRPLRIQPPMIYFIGDVPHDQGRQVRIVWGPGDPSYVGGWTQFSIWRMIPETDPPIWDFVDVVPFHGMQEYSYIAPTLIDSNSYTGPIQAFWSVFMVSAHTYNPWEFYDSQPEAGYSIDNLHPSPPGGLNASVGGDNSLIELSWRQVPDTDFDYYSVYRGLTSGFTPGIPIGYTSDTSFVDVNVNVGETYYYVVTATDFNGNEGEISEETNTILGVGDELNLPENFALAQNYPNPFNPVTSIDYAVPQAGLVTITVYNLLGEEISSLVNEVKGAGRYSVMWDAARLTSGMYFMQMRSGSFIETRKMMLLK